MRAIYLLLAIVLIGLAVYHYKNGYVRGWALLGENKKWTREDQPLGFWAILVGEIAAGVYVLVMAAS